MEIPGEGAGEEGGAVEEGVLVEDGADVGEGAVEAVNPVLDSLVTRSLLDLTSLAGAGRVSPRCRAGTEELRADTLDRAQLSATILDQPAEQLNSFDTAREPLAAPETEEESLATRQQHSLLIRLGVLEKAFIRFIAKSSCHHTTPTTRKITFRIK